MAFFVLSWSYLLTYRSCAAWWLDMPLTTWLASEEISIAIRLSNGMGSTIQQHMSCLGLIFIRYHPMSSDVWFAGKFTRVWWHRRVRAGHWLLAIWGQDKGTGLVSIIAVGGPSHCDVWTCWVWCVFFPKGTYTILDMRYLYVFRFVWKFLSKSKYIINSATRCCRERARNIGIYIYIYIYINI